MIIHYHRTPTIYNCKVCGDKVLDFPGHKYCYGCVVDEIYETIKNGESIKPILRQRARFKNIDIDDIRRNVEEDESSASWIFTDYGDCIACSGCGYVPRTTKEICPNCGRKML